MVSRLTTSLRDRASIHQFSVD